MRELSGSCLCGEVKFKCRDEFSQFHLCHCSECQKMTGTAHVANLFTKPSNIHWISGQENIQRFDVPGKMFSNAFCRTCGSRVPYVSKSGKGLIVPAGVLDSAPTIVPQDNIFWPERASWYDVGVQSKKFDGFPS